MPQHKNDLPQAAPIRELLIECGFFEGRYYIEMLLQKLESSKKSIKKIDPVAEQLLILVKNVKHLRDVTADESLLPEEKTTQYTKTLAEIDKCYKALVNASGSNGVLRQSRKILHKLGGAILGLIFATIGVIIGFFMALGQDLYHWSFKKSGVIPGAISGAAIGMLLGFRLPEPLLISQETRTLDLYVRSIGETFVTLRDSLVKDHLEELKTQTLKNIFNDDQDLFRAFCKGKHEFRIATFPAPGLTAKHKGIAGNHALIQISIWGPDKDNPGQLKEHKKLIELGRPSTEKDFKSYKGKNGINQSEVREATGEELLHMLAFDDLLQNRYRYHDGKKFNFAKLKQLFRLFSPGIDDCHTYVDRILAIIGQKPNQLNRSTNKDFIVGRGISAAIQSLSPDPSKFKSGAPVHLDLKKYLLTSEVEPVKNEKPHQDFKHSSDKGTGFFSHTGSNRFKEVEIENSNQIAPAA